MTKIQVKPDNLVLEIAEHETILTASLRNDIPHLHACGGIGRCSTCRISIIEGIANCLPPEKIELELARVNQVQFVSVGVSSDLRSLFVDVPRLL